MGLFTRNAAVISVAVIYNDYIFFFSLPAHSFGSDYTAGDLV